MSKTVSQTPKHRYGRHPHHFFKIPVTDATTHESMDEEWQTTKTAVVPSTGNAQTAVTRITLNKCALIFRSLNVSLIYKVLSLAQSAHIIMALAVVLVTVSMLPSDLETTSNANFNGVKVKPRYIVHFIYLASFSMHLGSQFWMTIVSGLSLYFNLSRHAFGDVQKILFPKYFSINSVLSAITLVQFGKIHVTTNVWDQHTFPQFFALSTCFLLELTIRLYVVPTVLRLIATKTAIEKSVGLGKEVGRCDLGRLTECPHYMIMHRIFRKIHMFMAIGNIITIMCSIFHLTYIAA
ncbi:PREDICTED: transmembrane protein 205-like [Diuraphis noxia]|uniref:transmembrane protein 205-like n=1 Tax=Diuraphis noxia TaxID=143948 RepID=UPI000763A2DA|nr:PREDICTED: transmembrane protein 205-like [Diuraphis noxia]